ncbi:phosphate acyltransferase, partial [Methylobacterium sp. J-076]|uniref:phosphate acyltransferase n=1 Tax=Methylobacterium sp. J-076 TaxID=2836655 RepID=UPI001FBA7D4E
LLLLLPLLLLVGAAVWMGDRKSPIFRHNRLGRGGTPFGCLKFRTMVVDAEGALAAHLAASATARAEWAATHKLTDDPRVTALGRVLRKTSLDELPQLVNVLRGEMRFETRLRIIRDVIGLQPGIKQLAAMSLIITNEGPYFLADTHVRENPTSEEIAEIAQACANHVTRFGITPKIALLSHSDFGQSDSASAMKM